MKVLVTGSNGQLASELKKISNGYNNLSWTFTSKKDLDLSKLNTINIYLNNLEPCIIINCAAYTKVDKAEAEAELANRVNHKAVAIISKWTNKNKKKLIHISTDYVFDGSIRVPLCEESLTNPINEYGSSKLKGEQVCLNNDPNSIIIRTSWLYSVFGKNFLKTIIELMKNNDSINVVNDQLGSPTYANDLANVIIKIIFNYKSVSGLFHYSNNGGITWYEFAKSIKEIFGLNAELIGIPSKEFKTIAARPKYSLLNNSKIKSTFNLKIPHYKKSLINCIKIIKSEHNI
jgi:dTDP-4-dehydrorhamnose reductase